MISGLRSASIALLAVLAVAPACLAGTGMEDGRGAIGGQIGGSYFWGFNDFSEGTQPRLAFEGHFRYMMTPNWRWQVAPGFLWCGYSGATSAPVPDGNFPGETSKGENLTLLLPVSFQIQYLMHTKKWHYHIGAGPGFYRLWIENHRIVLTDPVSFQKHRNVWFGLTGEVGVERFIRSLPSTSVEATMTQHLVYAEDDVKFPTGYSSKVAAFELRIGANYYFDMGRLSGKKTTELPPTHK